MAWKLSNWAESTLRQAIEAADTTIYIDATEVDDLPTLGVSDKAKAVIFDGTYREIVNITAWNTDGTLTVERAQESTAARSWSAGVQIVHTPTAEILQAVLSATANLKFVGTATGTNAYTANIGTGPIPTLADGEEVVFLVPNTNTTAAAPTLVVTNGTTSTASKAIKTAALAVPDDGDLAAGWLLVLRFNSANDCWVMIAPGSYQEKTNTQNQGPANHIARHPNGTLDKWNNGTSFSTPSTLTETADAWQVEYDGSIGTFTVSRQSFTLGQTTVPGNPRYFLRWDQSAAGSGSTVRRFRVKIPKANWRQGQKLTRRVWLKADTNRTVTAKVIQTFGTGGSPSADVTCDSQSWSVTAAWQQFEVTVTMPSITGKTLGSNLDDGIYLTLEFPLNVTMTMDVAVDDVRQGDIGGLAGDMWPLDFRYGGTGGSYASMTALLNAMGLGSSVSPSFGGLNLANGAVVNWNSSDILLTHTANALTGTGGQWIWTYNGAAGTAPVITRNTTDNATNKALDVASARATPAANDAVYMDFVLNNASSAQTTFGRIKAQGTTITGAAEVGKMIFSLVQGGAVTDYLALDSTGLYPTTNDGIPIGKSGNAFSDVFLALGAVLNFNTGDFTVTHSAGLLTMNGNITLSKANPRVTASNTSGTASSAVLAADSAAGWVGTTTNHQFSFYTNNTEKYRITAAGELYSISDVSPTDTRALGYLGMPLIGGAASNSAINFALVDAGHQGYHDEVTARTWTIPANGSVAFPIGTVICIDNTGNTGAAGTITLSITTDTLRRGDGTAGTGSRTIAAGQVAWIRKTKSTEWVITGTFS